MKKRIKAFLAGLLSAATIAGMAPMTVLAAEPTQEAAAAALPSKWDNSTNENAKYLPPVKSQGAFGSCAFWSTVYYQFTYMMNKARGVATTEDNTYSPNFIYNLTNGGNYGSPSTPLTPYQLLVVQGTPTIKDVPLTGSTTPATNYTSWHAEEGIWEHAMQNRLKDYVVYAYGSVQHPIYDFDTMTVIPANATISDPKDENLDAVKTAISNGEVLTFSSAILGWRYTNLKTLGAADNPNGYTIDTRFSGERAVYAAGSNILIADYLVSVTGHEMTIVGYNDEIWVDINDNNTVDKGEMGAFKIVNSWGDDWGNDGFMWIAYDAINQTSSVSNAPTVEKRAPAIHGVGGMVVSGKQDDSSDVYLSYTLNAPRRTEVRLTVIAKDQSGKTVKEFKVTPYETLNFYEHKNFSYNGHEGRCEDGIMAFDLNNVVADITSETLGNYAWSVKVEDQDEDLYTLNVKDIKIVDKKSGKTYPMDSAAFSLNGSTKTVDIPVGGATPDPDPTPENQVTIYYKGYSTPYIHYRTGAGTWTAVPGKAMTKTSEVSGYTHKYTIDLGKESYAEVCFNDGNNNWDSRNGANYKFNAGTYTFSNGTIKEYVAPTPTALTVSDVKLSSAYVPTNRNFTVTAAAAGGTAPYQYRFATSYRGNEIVLQDFSTKNTCTAKIGQYAAYSLIVTVKDAAGATATKSTNLTVTYAVINKLNADKETVKTGEKVRFSVTADTNNIPVTYKYTVKNSSGTVTTLSTNSDNTAAWVPKAEGKYTVSAEMLYNGDVISSMTRDYTVEKADIVNNQTTIYYIGFTNPYIHYRAGAGTWTTAPGKAMIKTSEVAGYTHMYTIDLGTETYAEVCFNDGNNNWDSRNGANYKFNAGTYTFSNGTIKEYVAPTPSELTVTAKGSDGYVPANKNFTVTATAAGGTAPYQYRFTTKYLDQEIVLQDYSANASCTASLGQYADYKVYVTVKDATGKTAQTYLNITVTTGVIQKLNADKETVKTGEKVRFSVTAETNNITVTYKYTVKNSSGTVTTLTTNSDNTAAWVPKAEGKYTVIAEMLYNGAVISSLTRDYTVEKADIVNHQVTIYYKGYNTPYIHYRAGAGTWTTAPGKAMIKTSEVAGYTHMYTIDLGSETYAEVCFNDGNNNWDSRNGANYKFNTGAYTFSNGTIKEYVAPTPTALSLNVSLSDATVPSNKQFTITASAKGGTAPYQYRYVAVYRGNETVLKDYSTSAACTATLPLYAYYTVKVTVKDAAGTTIEKETPLRVTYISSVVLTADKTTAKTGEKVTFTTQSATNGIPVTYKYTVTGNGTTTTLNAAGTTATWTPDKAGTYTARVDLLYKGESIAYHTTTCTVEKGSDIVNNQVTIYYKGYNTPYIHYRAGAGTWTAVPGKAMTRTSEIAGYTHKYTIDLGKESYAEVCFNDGNNNWDSRNGANYRFNTGTYTYANGSITGIGSMTDGGIMSIDPSLQNISAISEEIITLGETVTVNANAIGGEGDYTYTVSYKKKTSDKWTAVQYFKENNVITFKPAAAVEYDICVKVKDGAGAIVKKYYTVKAVKKLTNLSRISSVSIKKGSTTTLNCSAKGGEGEYTYTVSYKKQTSDKWTSAQYFKANNTVTLKPAAAVDYDICVKVKDAAGTIVKQYLTVNVTK